MDDLIEFLTEGAPDKRKLRLPTVDEVLYVRPMTGQYAGQGRACRNCMMWFKDVDRCRIMGPKKVDGADVCNYHVPGAPNAGKMKPHPGGMEFVDPKLAGLIDAPPGGTSCSNCAYSKAGRCQVVGDGKTGHAKIKPGGCCNRWMPR
jgi:hypothetical protein